MHFPVRLIGAATLLALLLPACTTNRFYTPNTMQIPMLTAKGQGTVSAGFAKDKNDTGWEVQSIYSPVKHLGLMLNHYALRYDGTTITDFSSSFYRAAYDGHTRFTEGALGGYFQTGSQKEYLLSLFSGFGQGYTKNTYSLPDIPSTETYVSEWDYRRFFIQPALGLQYRRLQIGTGLRFAWINYFNGNINSRVGVQETERIALLEHASPLFLTEMTWTIGWRLRPVTLSLNSTAVVRGKNSIRELDLASNYVSLMVGLNLHELKKKDK